MSKSILNKMAIEYVGDGKSPNLYFVTIYNGSKANTIAVCDKLNDAMAVARKYFKRLVYIEDRKHGIVSTKYSS